MSNEAVCQKCRDLKAEKQIAFECWRDQRAVNQQWGLRGKEAKVEVERYKQAYERACAKVRLHQATDHPETGMIVCIEDIELAYHP